ncbi:MAG: malic enzyme-like NAD(P)-binding protein, partial [Candidatus Nanohaloarchaea archaeon]|nr:malic enzyme-like NAD(P)-binding protein [Candidatus Nanohaloarchaea archaeon]
RSDFPNQINNSLVFPGVARGCLACFAENINVEMQLAAADAVASCVDQPSAEKVVPGPLDREVADAVADAVAEAGRETGECQER